MGCNGNGACVIGSDYVPGAGAPVAPSGYGGMMDSGCAQCAAEAAGVAPSGRLLLSPCACKRKPGHGGAPMPGGGGYAPPPPQSSDRFVPKAKAPKAKAPPLPFVPMTAMTTTTPPAVDKGPVFVAPPKARMDEPKTAVFLPQEPPSNEKARFDPQYVPARVIDVRADDAPITDVVQATVGPKATDLGAAPTITQLPAADTLANLAALPAVLDLGLPSQSVNPFTPFCGDGRIDPASEICRMAQSEGVPDDCLQNLLTFLQSDEAKTVSVRRWIARQELCPQPALMRAANLVDEIAKSAGLFRSSGRMAFRGFVIQGMPVGASVYVDGRPMMGSWLDPARTRWGVELFDEKMHTVRLYTSKGEAMEGRASVGTVLYPQQMLNVNPQESRTSLLQAGFRTQKPSAALGQAPKWDAPVRIVGMPWGGRVFINGVAVAGRWEDTAMTRWMVMAPPGLVDVQVLEQGARGAPSNRILASSHGVAVINHGLAQMFADDTNGLVGRLNADAKAKPSSGMIPGRGDQYVPQRAARPSSGLYTGEASKGQFKQDAALVAAFRDEPRGSLGYAWDAPVRIVGMPWGGRVTIGDREVPGRWEDAAMTRWVVIAHRGLAQVKVYQQDRNVPPFYASVLTSPHGVAQINYVPDPSYAAPVNGFNNSNARGYIVRLNADAKAKPSSGLYTGDGSQYVGGRHSSGRLFGTSGVISVARRAAIDAGARPTAAELRELHAEDERANDDPMFRDDLFPGDPGYGGPAGAGGGPDPFGIDPFGIDPDPTKTNDPSKTGDRQPRGSTTAEDFAAAMPAVTAAFGSVVSLVNSENTRAMAMAELQMRERQQNASRALEERRLDMQDSFNRLRLTATPAAVAQDPALALQLRTAQQNLETAQTATNEAAAAERMRSEAAAAEIRRAAAAEAEKNKGLGTGAMVAIAGAGVVVLGGIAYLVLKPKNNTSGRKL